MESGGRCGERWVEAFDVTDLQHKLARAGGVNQRIGFGYRKCNRLFHQEMSFGFGQFHADPVVVFCGRGNDRRIDFPLQAAVILEGVDVKGIGDSLPSCRRGIDNADQFDIIDRLGQASMNGTQVSRAYHCDA